MVAVRLSVLLLASRWVEIFVHIRRDELVEECQRRKKREKGFIIDHFTARASAVHEKNVSFVSLLFAMHGKEGEIDRVEADARRFCFYFLSPLCVVLSWAFGIPWAIDARWCVCMRSLLCNVCPVERRVGCLQQLARRGSEEMKIIVSIILFVRLTEANFHAIYICLGCGGGTS